MSTSASPMTAWSFWVGEHSTDFIEQGWARDDLEPAGNERALPHSRVTDLPVSGDRRLVVRGGRTLHERAEKLLYVSSGQFGGEVWDVLGEDVVDLAGDVALETAEDVEVGFAIR